MTKYDHFVRVIVRKLLFGRTHEKWGTKLYDNVIKISQIHIRKKRGLTIQM